MLERLRLLLRDVLAKSPQLRCTILLPLPAPLAGAYIAYDPLMAMSATQGAVVLRVQRVRPKSLVVVSFWLLLLLPPCGEEFLV